MEDPSAGEGSDICIFPDMIKYFGVKPEHVDALVRSVCEKTTYDQLESMVITGTWIFVCCHHARDARCGTCGPRLYKEFCENLTTVTVPRLYDPVFVKRVSHCSAHTFAGNVIVYKYSKAMKKYFGDFYGFVEPTDVKTIIQSHILNDKIVLDLWMGRCDCSKETAINMMKLLK
jgi:(2Fe-2S) ferredoxin